jgi:hypothetical protein
VTYGALINIIITETQVVISDTLHLQSALHPEQFTQRVTCLKLEVLNGEVSVDKKPSAALVRPASQKEDSCVHTTSFSRSCPTRTTHLR